MTKEKIFEGFKEAKDYLIFIFIFILFFLPLFKEYYPSSIIFMELDYPILIIGGIIGIFFSAICLSIRYYISDNKKQFYINMIPIFLLILYMLWTLISSFFAEDKELAFLGTWYRKDGYLTYIAYAGVFGVSFFIDSKEVKKILLYFFIIAAILTIILVQIANYTNSFSLVYNRDITTTSFSNTNHYGYYLLLLTSISAFLFISTKNNILKIFFCFIYSFILYFLIKNNTFGCYLALLFTFVFYTVIITIKKWEKKYIIISITIFVFLSLVITSKINENITKKNISILAKDIQTISSSNSSDKRWQQSGSGRMKLWKYGIQFFAEKPILGYGPENLGNKYNEININQDRPHNLLIQLATTSGLPGLILYISAIRNYII